MIATLNFEKSLSHFQLEPELQPGLRRIDELMAVVLARYEQAECADIPEVNLDRICRQGPEIPGGRPRTLAKTHSQ